MTVSSFMTYCRVCNYNNTTGATSGAGTAFPSEAPEFTPGFQWGSYYSIFSFMCNVLQIVVCPFVLFLFAIVLSVFLQFTDSDYPLVSSSSSFTIQLVMLGHSIVVKLVIMMIKHYNPSLVLLIIDWNNVSLTGILCIVLTQAS